jgi:hypothetical protein
MTCRPVSELPLPPDTQSDRQQIAEGNQDLPRLYWPVLWPIISHRHQVAARAMQVQLHWLL